MSFVGEGNIMDSRAMQKIKETQNLSEVSQPFKQGLTIESCMGYKSNFDN
uniref:CG12378-PA n=1 Tax=Drosophila erecta TaxID=7220 RepID=Q8I1J1_DROER|nr:CG12378-PA [Drosophila erecta]